MIFFQTSVHNEGVWDFARSPGGDSIAVRSEDASHSIQREMAGIEYEFVSAGPNARTFGPG
jgi:hypothetical protein